MSLIYLNKFRLEVVYPPLSAYGETLARFINLTFFLVASGIAAVSVLFLGEFHELGDEQGLF